MSSFDYDSREINDADQSSIQQRDELDRVNDLIDQQKILAKYASRES